MVSAHDDFRTNLLANAQQDKYNMQIILRLLLGVSTTGFGIYAIIVASNNIHDACLSTAHVAGLNLAVMIIIESVGLMLGGLYIMRHSTETTEQQEKRKADKKKKTEEQMKEDPCIFLCVYCCLALAGIFLLIAYIITLTGTCINDNMLLFVVGIIVVLWSLVAPVIIWILNTCYATAVNITTHIKQIEHDLV